MPVLDVDNVNQIIRTTSAFRILSDPTRCRILCLLSSKRQELCVNEIADAVGISHSAASHQLSKLELQGVVVSRRDGQAVCYELTKKPFTKNLLHVLSIFTTAKSTQV